MFAEPIPVIVLPVEEVIPVVMLPAAAPPPMPFIALAPPPSELPPAIRAMARAAFDAGDDHALDSVLKLARKSFPEAEQQAEALASEYGRLRAERQAQAKREREERLAVAGLFDNWSGEAEIGGAISTGNTSSTALYGALGLSREGLRWQHKVKGRADFQRSNGETVADRLSLGWEPGYKIHDGMFVYGLGQFERDRFLGFASRFTLSSGVGMALVARPEVTLTVQGGPAVRRVDYVDRGVSIQAAGRASASLRWKLAPSLDLTQDAALYVGEQTGTNAVATTSVETRLLGNVKAKLSYNVQYEDSAVDGHGPVDTTSRVTLVYGF